MSTYEALQLIFDFATLITAILTLVVAIIVLNKDKK